LFAVAASCANERNPQPKSKSRERKKEDEYR
jgi:hypothetical protein